MSGGFCLLLTLLLFLDDDNIVPWALLACLLHELGHLCAIHLMGGRVAAFRLSVIGAEMIPTHVRLFSYREELLIAAAGPLASLLIALVAASLAGGVGQFEGSAFLFAGLNLAVGVFNLLPIGPLDGGRILRILLLHGKRPWEGELLYEWITRLLSLVLVVLGGVHMLRLGGNPTLLLTGLWLLSTAGKGGVLSK